jgi:hypothetical protein
MNPYKEDGPRARLSFDRAYCKRCIGPSSVNDGYITGLRPLIEPIPRRRAACAAARPLPPGCGNAPPGAAGRAVGPAALSRAPREPAAGETLSPRLKVSFGSAATGPL